jgi:aldoxime dehydratase
MESAIPDHLVCPRTRSRRVADDHVPPYPSFVARLAPGVKQVVMAYFGVQHEGAATAADGALAALRERLRGPDGAGHIDAARWSDPGGATNRMFAAYWDEPARFERWFAAHGRAWTREPIAGVGAFAEVLQPRVERFETLFSSPERAEGIAVLAPKMSGEVMEHAYWGGARDRIAASQTDALQPAGAPRVERDGAFTRVVGSEAMCLIRSGQDWSATGGDERAMYLHDVEPVLRAGMDFLRDHGREVGCLSNRYVEVETEDGAPSERSYGLGWWKSLAALERWAESHPTHLAIFGAAMRYLSALGPQAKLKLYHEVSVVGAGEQWAEYRGCRPGTGLLAAF